MKIVLRISLEPPEREMRYRHHRQLTLHSVAIVAAEKVRIVTLKYQALPYSSAAESIAPLIHRPQSPRMQ